MPRYAPVATLALVEEVEIPEGVSVEVDDGVIRVRGPLGTLEKRYHKDVAEVEVDGRIVRVTVYGRRKFHRAYVKTVAAHVKNMIEGVTKGFEREMIVVFAHFPMRVEVDGERRLVVIENFMGEKRPRYAKIVGESTEVEVKGDRVIVRGISKEDVGQTVANIRLATKIRKKDPRVFMDGIYPLD